MGLPVTSPDISNLNFTIAYDISGAVPAITLTNASAGAHLSLCTWWYEVLTPNGIPIHQGTSTSPDVTSNTWTTLVVPETWQTPFGTYPGGGQVEFSCSVPYAATLFVKDSIGNVFSFTISQTICRPNGNTDLTMGNFGAAIINVNVQCANARVYGLDKTNYAYQTLLGTPQNQEWTMTYPLDANGNPVTPATAENAAYVLFPINFTGDGYGIYLNTFCTYIFPNGATIKIQYKSQSNPSQRTSFAVWCNVNLCNLASEINKLYRVAQKKCGQVEYPGIMDRIAKINLLMHEVHIGIEQPLCGIDVPCLIKEIEKIGEFNCNCCGNSGVNFGNNLPIPSNTSGCCPSSTPIWAYGTTASPVNCTTGGYIPASVYAPDGTTFIGIAYTTNDIVSIMNNNAAWIALGTAFNEGSCKVGFYPANPGTTIPSIIVGVGIGTGYGSGATPPCINNNQNYLAVLTDKCSGYPTTTLPTTVYINYGGSDINLGVISSVSGLLSALNSESSKPASFSYSIGAIAGQISILVHNNNCPGTSGLLTLKGSNDCGGGTTVIVSNIIDTDTGVAPVSCPGSYFPASVDAPNGTTIIGVANNPTDLINLINANAAWNAYGTAVYNGSNCSVSFNANTGVTTIPNIKVKISSSCVGGTINYTIPVSDVCTTSSILTPASFPCDLFVDWGLGAGNTFLGSVSTKIALIAALNADTNKPSTVAIADNTLVASDIIINESDCTYTQTPSIKVGLQSMDFLFYGGNHDLMEPTQLGVAAVQAIGLANNSLPGQVKGFVSDDPVWHVIHVDKYMICSVQHLAVGQIKVYDMSVPLFPVFVKAVTLPDTGSGTCFSGMPESITVASGGVPITSIYGLYFVTDNPGQMALNAVYVTEPLTGSIWKMDLTPGGAGVTAQFAYQKLLGKCPRVILGNKIYYTQDGDLETAASLVSGVTFGDIVILNLATFNSGGVSTQNIFAAQEQVWAATYDGTSLINFVGNQGALATYTVSTSTVANTYASAFSACLYRLNIKSYLNVIFASSFDFVGKNTGTQRLTITSLPTITRTDFQSFKKPGSSVFSTTHYNPLPLGNCLVAVTTDNWQDLASKTGMLAIYAVDGTFIKQIGYDGGNIYNVISFPGISNYTPNGLT